MEKKEKASKRIGVLGGTFNPIHYGHLIIAQWAKENFALDKVIFIPAGMPPHKSEKTVLSARHRYEMTLLATIDVPDFEVSPMEIHREGPSYTIDTIRQLSAYYSSETKIFFITGADSILELHTWSRYKELLQSCFFIAATREGYNTQELLKRTEEIQQEYGKRIFNMKIPAIEISSTELRSRIQAGKTIKYLIPPSVEKYINKYKLY